MGREELVIVTTIPDELRAVLGAKHSLVPLDIAGDLSRFRVAVTTSMAGFDATLMARLPALKLIACNGVGLDRIDMAEAATRGIQVANTPGVLTEDVADAAIGLMFAIARRQTEADRFVRAGRWGPEKMVLSSRIAGATLGIIGMGRIGQAIARRGAGLGMDVCYTSRSLKPDLPYQHISSAIELAHRSKIVILACPGGQETHNLVNTAFLDALGPKGFLVNISRGEVVDEDALILALQQKRIGGAALDVFKTEPEIDPRLFPLDNVVLQPHYAALTNETRADIAAMLYSAIDTFLNQGR